MSPLEIEVLLRFYWDPNAQLNIHNSPAHQQAVARFVEAGLLQFDSEGTTSRIRPNLEPLRMYVEALMAVPLPVKGWRMPS